MADPTPQLPDLKPWWVTLLDWVEKFIKDNWSGLAVMLYDYEEKKVDTAKQELQTAQLKEKLATDENEIRKNAGNESATDIINEELGKPKS
jgi:hypothetical protein